MNDSDVIIYTDGSSRGNPGPGGYGIVMEHCKSGYVKEYSKGFKLTTNNRMELLAVIEALKKLKQIDLLTYLKIILLKGFQILMLLDYLKIVKKTFTIVLVRLIL